MSRHFASSASGGTTAILLTAALAAAGPTAASAPLREEPVREVSASAETAPVEHARDAADDPAIWVDHDTPADSLVIGNDKKGALETYALDGTRRQRITSDSDFWGNVDVRQGVRLNGRTVDVVAAMNGRLRLYVVDPRTRTLAQVGRTHTADSVKGQGMCLYDSPTSGLSAFVVDNVGRVRQFIVRGMADGDLEVRLARTLDVVTGTPPPEATEACVADDSNGDLYVAEENVGLWRYQAEPDASRSARTLVDRVGPDGHLVADVEGLALTYGSTDYLIASAQNVAAPDRSYFAVYRRTGANAFLGTFRIVSGVAADGCERTDGIAAYDGYLGPRFPQGLFVCQDNSNTAPEAGRQNFKLVRLERILS